MPKILACDPAFLIDHAYHSDCRRWIDCAAWVLIIKTDIASHDRGAEFAACFSQPLHRFTKLPEICRLIWISEVQIIRDRKRCRSGTDQVSCSFSYSNAGPLARIQSAI